MKLAQNRIYRVKPVRLVPGRTRSRGRRARGHGSSLQQDTIAPVIVDPVVAGDVNLTASAPEIGARESLAGDSYQLYLHEIGQVNLLTPGEEVALAKRIKRGDPAAREHMIKANLRLVVKIAREFEGLGLPLLDLINEGNIGLMKAVDRFDPKKGAKFSTYAALWIKQAIRRGLTNLSKTIRLPVHVMEKLARIRKSETKLQEALDREPTDEEVAEDMDLDVRRIQRYRQAGRAPISLEAPLNDDGSASVSDLVADARAAAPFDRVVSTTDNEVVKEALEMLDDRESKILTMRFGLGDDEPRTLEELGEHFGVTRERVRQIQEEALRKMRYLIDKRDRLQTSAIV